jgi:hypothetical protein
VRGIYKVGKAEDTVFSVLQIVECLVYYYPMIVGLQVKCSMVPCQMFSVLLPYDPRIAGQTFVGLLSNVQCTITQLS